MLMLMFMTHVIALIFRYICLSFEHPTSSISCQGEFKTTNPMFMGRDTGSRSPSPGAPPVLLGALGTTSGSSGRSTSIGASSSSFAAAAAAGAGGAVRRGAFGGFGQRSPPPDNNASGTSLSESPIAMLSERTSSDSTGEDGVEKAEEGALTGPGSISGSGSKGTDSVRSQSSGASSGRQARLPSTDARTAGVAGMAAATAAAAAAAAAGESSLSPSWPGEGSARGRGADTTPSSVSESSSRPVSGVISVPSRGAVGGGSGNFGGMGSSSGIWGPSEAYNELDSASPSLSPGVVSETSSSAIDEQGRPQDRNRDGMSDDDDDAASVAVESPSAQGPPLSAGVGAASTDGSAAAGGTPEGGRGLDAGSSLPGAALAARSTGKETESWGKSRFASGGDGDDRGKDEDDEEEHKQQQQGEEMGHSPMATESRGATPPDADSGRGSRRAADELRAEATEAVSRSSERERLESEREAEGGEQAARMIRSGSPEGGRQRRRNSGGGGLSVLRNTWQGAAVLRVCFSSVVSLIAGWLAYCASLLDFITPWRS